MNRHMLCSSMTVAAVLLLSASSLTADLIQHHNAPTYPSTSGSMPGYYFATTGGIILGGRFTTDVGAPDPFKVTKLMLFAQGENGQTDITLRIRLWDSSLNLKYTADYAKSVSATPHWEEFVIPSSAPSFSGSSVSFYAAFEEVSNTGHVQFYYDSPIGRGFNRTWKFTYNSGTNTWTKANPPTNNPNYSADYIFSAEISPDPVPEPVTLAILVGGGLFLMRTRRRR